jgi:hypothetical protein
MKKTLIAFALLSAGVNAVAELDMTVLGVSLNAPISVPECKRNIAGTGYDYEFTKEACFIHGYRVDKNKPSAPPENGKVEIKLPLQEQPFFFKNYLVCYIIDGKVQGVKFQTTGHQYQRETLDLLVKKYGSPSTNNAKPLQNAYGAKYQAEEFIWDLPGLSVVYSSVTDKIDVGSIAIMTPSALEYVKQENSKLQNAARSL